MLAICGGLAAATTSPCEANSHHERIRTARGPLHVWAPADFDATTADLVIYVHGYFVTIDQAWRRHRLARQFERAGRNALFVVPGAPSAHVDPIDWPSLDELIANVPRAPAGRVIVVAHSGAIRTIRSWFASERLSAVVLLDAMYGPLPEVVPWLAADASHRLIDVSEMTRPWADELHRELPDTITLDAIPDPTDDLRAARILHLRTQIGHHELVTEGKVIPRLLQLL